ncbi:MAG: hypothetical protein SGJ27_28620 [Candidatus Melainabacteria bacterium]|nr:hypothetical protein [Candidatus Melainabacteria bacterium]
MGLLEGFFVVIVATAVTVWVNDNFEIGGDYIELAENSTKK